MHECLDSFGGLVWSLVIRRCPNRADAEEVVQEVFLDLWKSAHRFDPTVASESTFVAMITRRRLIDRRRKMDRTLSASSLPDDNQAENTRAAAAHNDDAACQVDIADEAALVREKMEELKPEEKSVLELAIDHGLSHSQISERTQLPLGTVKTHARRGLIRLRELLIGKIEIEGGAR